MCARYGLSGDSKDCNDVVVVVGNTSWHLHQVITVLEAWKKKFDSEAKTSAEANVEVSIPYHTIPY